MENKHKKFILDHLHDDDSLERAESAWRNLSEEDLNKPYGQSDKTKRELLLGWREKRAQFDAAREWLEKL